MTLVIAHRGASAYKPENTIAAFRAAVELGTDGIELDVHGSADGTIVVHHDPAVEDLVIGDVAYHEMVANLEDRGATTIPPTLAHALTAIGPETTVYIEVKSLRSNHDDALLRVIAEAPNPKNCQIHSFDHRIVQRLVRAKPTLHGGVLSTSYPVRPVPQISDALAQTLWQQRTMIDRSLVEEVHQAGKTVIAWTVDDEDQMRHLHRIGVDGICTNMPDRARRVLS